MKKRQISTGAAVLAIALMIGCSAWAQAAPELGRALAKTDPAGELVADFNELVSAATNIAPPSAAPDEDRAKAKEVRGALQDPAGLAMARDPNRQAAAAAPKIAALAASLDQGIGDRLSADARAGMVRDFKTIAQYMAIVRPDDTWYCAIHGLRVLLPC
jgi:hypothetical protein